MTDKINSKLKSLRVKAHTVILKSIFQKMKLIKKTIFFTLLTALLLLIPGLTFPALIRLFVTQIVIDYNFTFVYGIAIGLILVVLFEGMLNHLQQLILQKSYIRLSITSSSQTLWHLLRLPYAYFSQRNAAELAYRLDANDTICNTITNFLIPTSINCLLIIFYGATLIYYDKTIALFGFCVIAFNFLVLNYLYRSKSDAFTHYQSVEEKSISYSMNIISNIHTIKEMGMEYRVFSTWAGHFAKTINAFYTIAQRDVVISIFPNFFEIITIMAVLGIGGWKVINGGITIGMLIAIQILMRSLIRPVMSLINLSEKIQYLKIDLEKLDEINNHPIDDQYLKTNSKNKNIKDKLEGYLNIENVCFSYESFGEDTIKNIYLSLTPGKSIALVGTTGSGKSTLVKLIAGLYPPKSGQILFDSIPATEIPNSSIRNTLSVVEQTPFIFHGTIRENITFLDTTIEDDEIIKAAKDVCIHDLILSRKGGYNFIVEQDGNNLSGGQIQCLEIARALVKKPKILILDEATSSLDSESETEVIKNIQRRGMGLIMIAHRLNTIQNCDEIIVLDKGVIIAQGTHQELKASCELYQEMIITQKELVQFQDKETI